MPNGSTIEPKTERGRDDRISEFSETVGVPEVLALVPVRVPEKGLAANCCVDGRRGESCPELFRRLSHASRELAPMMRASCSRTRSCSGVGFGLPGQTQRMKADINMQLEPPRHGACAQNPGRSACQGMRPS
eukprot:6210528-Pleurochrysis_carterae.AAC.1